MEGLKIMMILVFTVILIFIIKSISINEFGLLIMWYWGMITTILIDRWVVEQLKQDK